MRPRPVVPRSRPVPLAGTAPDWRVAAAPGRPRLDAMRLVRAPLDGDLPPAAAALRFAADRRPFALVGAWAGGGALIGSEPLWCADDPADPFGLVAAQPPVADAEPGAVGGGWFGFLGYGLGGMVEPVPPPPPRPRPLPLASLSFHDHVLRLDAAGRWWFEALWSDARDAFLRRRLALLQARLAAPAPRPRALDITPFVPGPPGARGHLAAVAAARERIAAGEIFQANLCLRLEGRWSPAPLDLLAHGVAALDPAYAAALAGPWGSLVSLSPELFLRRRGREVETRPIKGTAPWRAGGDRELAAAAKDRAENVMIVDLMRNDLGRVCEYGSIAVRALAEPVAGAGVWHLESAVTGRLRRGAADGDLLRATFPPGSVTGAPKVQAMRVIAELEATGREAYTGAVGYASPVAGLELNVAIRTFESQGDRIWLGVGGGIVADSDPRAELEECAVKARPILTAAGTGLAAPAARRRRSPRGPAPRPALAPDRARPDPSLGVFETLAVAGGRAAHVDAHLSRLARSVRRLYGGTVPEDLTERVAAAAQAACDRARLRVLWSAADGDAELELGPAPPQTGGPVALAPVTLPGGLGAHKWRDRRALDGLAAELRRVPLLVDADGAVLEAAHANVFVLHGDRLRTPPLDGRILPGTTRVRVLAAARALGLEASEEEISLAHAAAADVLLLSSALRGLHAATLGDRSGAETPAVRALRAALEGETAVSSPATA